MRAIYYPPQDSAFVVFDNGDLIGFAAPAWIVNTLAQLGGETPKEIVVNLVNNDIEANVRRTYSIETITLADLDQDQIEEL